jgi:hypothetical protein
VQWQLLHQNTEKKKKKGNEGLVSLKNSLKKRIEAKYLHPCQKRGVINAQKFTVDIWFTFIL